MTPAMACLLKMQMSQGQLTIVEQNPLTNFTEAEELKEGSLLGAVRVISLPAAGQGLLEPATPYYHSVMEPRRLKAF